MVRASSLSALACASTLAACGGGAISSHPATLPASKPGSATAQFTIVVPGMSTGSGTTAQSTNVRMLVRPNYVSENAQSLVVTIGGVNGFASTFNLSVTSNGCSQPGGPGTAVTCTESIDAPVGSSEAWAFDLYSETNGSGSLLAMTNEAVTIRPGVANNLGAFTLNGVVGSYSLTWEGGVPSLFPDSDSAPQLVLDVQDPSGATIIAPGEYVDGFGNPVTFNLTDDIATFGAPFSNTQWTYTISPTSFGPAAATTPTSNVVTMSYGGIAMPSSTIDVTDSENVQSGGAVLTVPSPAPVPVIVDSADVTCFGGAQFYAPDIVDLLGVDSGCTLPFTEAGWTDSPFGQSLTESTACAGSGLSVVPTGNNAWIISEVSGIGPPVCFVTVSGPGSSIEVSVTIP